MEKNGRELLSSVKKSTVISNQTDLAAVIMQEGLAYICLIVDTSIVVQRKIVMDVPHKRKGVTGQHDVALDQFIDIVIKGIEKDIKFDIIKCIILVSPGVLKDKVFEKINKLATKGNKIFLMNK